MGIWGKSIPGRGSSQCKAASAKALRLEHVWNVRGTEETLQLSELSEHREDRRGPATCGPAGSWEDFGFTVTLLFS